MKGGLDARRRVWKGRRFGASPEHRARLNAYNETQTWVGRCRTCGADLKGSLAELAAHRCGGDSGEATHHAPVS